jgi:hypothetical protein
MAFEELRIEMKCKDFHIEVEEGLKGESLSIAAQDHSASCHPCREFNQKHVEFREWLMVCEKITAPKDFQFGVQRKIAVAGGAHSHHWTWNRLGYIVPSTALAAALVLGGSYFFNSQNVTGNPSAASIAEPENRSSAAASDAPVPPDNPAMAQSNNPAEAPKQGDEKIALAVNVNKQDTGVRIAVPKENPDSEKGLGSLDQGATNVAPPELPKGINLPPNNQANRSKTLINLSALGAKATVADMRVSQISENSPAARAGVKVGDVVESLNGNVLTIRRGGQTMQIVIK